MGRKPVVRTEENAKAIIEALCDGKPLVTIARELGIGVQTVYDWRDQDEAFAVAIARAREIGFDAIAADIMPIADDRGDDPASRRIRVEARLKLLAKWDPKRFGDRVDHTSSDGSMSPQPPIYQVVEN